MLLPPGDIDGHCVTTASRRRMVGSVTRAHDRPVKDVIVTVVVAIVLAIVFVYLFLSFAFSGWGDRSEQGSTSAISGRILWETFVDS